MLVVVTCGSGGAEVTASRGTAATGATATTGTAFALFFVARFLVVGACGSGSAEAIGTTATVGVRTFGAFLWMRLPLGSTDGADIEESKNGCLGAKFSSGQS